MQLQFADLKKKNQAPGELRLGFSQAKMQLTEQKSFADKNGSNSSMVWLGEHFFDIE